MKALILAAGFGVRLREIVHGRPKHLVLINGKPFLRYLIQLLKKQNIKEVAISVGYLAHYIIDEFAKDNEGINIKFLEDNRPVGTAGSIKKASKIFKNDFFILNGDTYLNIDYKKLMDFHKKHKALLTIVATSKHKNKGGIILCNKHKIVKFISSSKVEVPKNSLRNAGVYVASPEIFQFIPSNLKISLEKEIIPKLLNKNKKILVFHINKRFFDIGSPEELKIISKQLK